MNEQLTDDQRTETLIEGWSSDSTRICGCSYWREESDEAEDDDNIMVQWCERHAPSHLAEHRSDT